MAQAFPLYISLLFIAITVITFYLLILILRKSAVSGKLGFVLTILAIWLVIQAALALNDVYSSNLNHLPPKILVFGILPAFIVILVLFLTKSGRTFIDSLPLQLLTLLSLVRIFVEIELLFLYLSKFVPKGMTMEGGNLDIISGLTAPLVAYVAFHNGGIKRGLLLVWNFLCLALLINILTRALLSAPFPSQKLAFDQPNIAILHFPVVWLPTFIVPLIFFSHLASIRQLFSKSTRVIAG